MSDEKKKWSFPSAYLRTDGVNWGPRNAQPELHWEGTNVALVRFPGHSGSGGVFRDYYETRWEVIAKRGQRDFFTGSSTGDVLFSYEPADVKKGKATKLTIAQLIEKAKELDAEAPKLEAARKKKEQAERDEQDAATEAREREAKREEQIRELARKKYPNTDTREIDAHAEVNLDEENGTGGWVQAWLWVDAP